jgi:hypothetical protein
MATRRNEPLADVARVALRFVCEEVAAVSFVPLHDSADPLEESSSFCDRYGFEVKKLRFRGMQAGVVRWNERRGRGPISEI